MGFHLDLHSISPAVSEVSVPDCRYSFNSVYYPHHATGMLQELKMINYS